MASNSSAEALAADCREIDELRERQGLNRAAEYVRFWAQKAVQEPHATHFVAAFLALYLGIQTGEYQALSVHDLLSSISSVTPLAKPDAGMLRHADGLLCSVYFLTLFRKLERNSGTLRGIIGRLQQLRSAGGGSAFVEKVAARLSSAVSESTILTTVHEATHIEVSEEPSVFDRDASLLAPSLLFFFLQQRTAHYGAANAVLGALTDALAGGASELGEQRCLVLLHVARVLLATAPRLDVERVAKLARVLRTYMLWPLPVGDVARELLQRVSVEQRAPGSLLLSRFAHEVPELRESAQRYPKNRTVHFVLDAASAYSRMLAEICNAELPRDCTLRELRQALLRNVLRRTLGRDTDDVLRTLSTAALSDAFAAAVDALEEAALLDSDERAAAHRAAKLGELAASLSAREKTSGAEPYARSHLELPPLLLSFLSVISDSSVPRTKDTVHVGGARWPRREYMQDALKKIVSLYTPYASARSGKRETVRIGVLGGDAILHTLLTSYVVLRHESPKLFAALDVQFYVLPTDLCAFASFVARCDPWYARHAVYAPLCALRMWPRFYESGEHAQEGMLTGNLVATRAAAATRERANTSASLRAPRATRAERYAAGSGEYAMTPSLLVRSSLEHYVRHARNRVEVAVYRVECVPVGGSAATAFAVPCVSRVELGLSAVHRVMDMRGELSDAAAELPDHERPLPKGWAGVPLAVRCNAVNSFGTARPGVLLPRTAYHQLTLSNHAHCRDLVARSSYAAAAVAAAQGAKSGSSAAALAAHAAHSAAAAAQSTPAALGPDPTAPWLELSLLEYDAHRRAKSAALARLAAATHYTSAVEVDGDERGFDVLIDGQYFGLCKSLRVSPLHGDAKAKQARGAVIGGNAAAAADAARAALAAQADEQIGPITFPVMTFLPLAHKVTK